MSRRTVRLSFDFGERPSTRPCDMPGCTGHGEYRAPKGRDRLAEYYWFCLEHVREYNAAWDYYRGMSEQEIEAELRRDTTWQRPTWPMGDWRVQEERMRTRVRREFGVGGETGGHTHRNGSDAGHANCPKPRSAEAEALNVLELDPPVEFAAIKARYRALVKRHHPDANGGDKAAEEKLKLINQAYTTLKASYGA